jgi:hypothetical protein
MSKFQSESFRVRLCCRDLTLFFLLTFLLLRSIEPGSTIYYSIPGGNGTRPSDVLTVKTALKPGEDTLPTRRLIGCDGD